MTLFGLKHYAEIGHLGDDVQRLIRNINESIKLCFNTQHMSSPMLNSVRCTIYENANDMLSLDN